MLIVTTLIPVSDRKAVQNFSSTRPLAFSSFVNNKCLEVKLDVCNVRYTRKKEEKSNRTDNLCSRYTIYVLLLCIFLKRKKYRERGG